MSTNLNFLRCYTAGSVFRIKIDEKTSSRSTNQGKRFSRKPPQTSKTKRGALAPFFN